MLLSEASGRQAQLLLVSTSRLVDWQDQEGVQECDTSTPPSSRSQAPPWTTTLIFFLSKFWKCETVRTVFLFKTIYSSVTLSMKGHFAHLSYHTSRALRKSTVPTIL